MQLGSTKYIHRMKQYTNIGHTVTFPVQQRPVKTEWEVAVGNMQSSLSNVILMDIQNYFLISIIHLWISEIRIMDIENSELWVAKMN